MIGTRLLHYEIEAHLGTGGMGEVYRARDTRLGRHVAIKVLPELVAQDPDRVARFEREARLLASLNHPNIAALHGLEPSESRLLLVMELVEGDTLAERIQRGPIPVEEALTYARQIAEALEAAHEKGVIHRDLKPANVKITPDGKVKVLDFGLAKAMDPAEAGHYVPGGAAGATHSPTLSMAATFAGVILGTAAYMSPEQAKGVATDQRSDIFSFGCVLYEMLTGRQPFQGDTVTEVMASVLKSDADLTLLPPSLNPRIAELIRRCMAKDPKRRWHAAADLRMEIEAILADPRGLMAGGEASAAHQPAWRRAIPFAATALAAAAIAAAVAWNMRPAPAVPIARFSHVLPDDQQLTRTGRHNIALSPDGQSIVYVANNQLYIRGLGELEARPIPGTNQDINTPFFSPDGQWIGFYAVPEAKLKKIAITGGASVTIADVTNPYGATWESDDQILVGQGEQGIVRVSANGGTPETIVKVDVGEFAHGPQMLPDGDHVLFTLAKGAGATRWDQAQVVVQSLESGERTVLINGGSDARYVPTGHIIYGLGTNLLAVPFDEQSRTVTGGPVPLLEGIGRSVPINTAAMFFSVSPSGSLVYFAGTVGDQGAVNLARVDRKGVSVTLPMPPQHYVEPRISPDGTQLAVEVAAENESNVWIYDVAGTLAPRRLTFGGTNTAPAWAPDGARVAFISTRDEGTAIFWQPADGSGSAERLTDPKTSQPTHMRFSADGNIVYREGGVGDIWMLPLTGDKKPRGVIVARGNQWGASLSPDGRWITYSSNESGRDEVYVQPFPPTGAKYQVTTTYAHDPLWSPDGRQIFYLQHPGSTVHPLMSVDVRTAAGFTVANPIRIYDELLDGSNAWPYDVSPDGREFVITISPANANADATPNAEIRVTLNWFEELRQRVPR